MALRLVALLILSASIMLLHRAASPILEQNQKVREWPSVDASVTLKNGTPHRLLEYRYVVGRTIHNTVHVVREERDLAPFGPSIQTGSTFTHWGYYNPAKDGEMFFPRPFGFADYWQVFLWGSTLAIGFGGVVIRKQTDRYRASSAWGVTIVSGVICGLAINDYFNGTPRTHGPISNALMTLGMLPSLVALAFAVYFTSRAKREIPAEERTGPHRRKQKGRRSR